MQLSDIGNIAKDCFAQISVYYPYAEIPLFTIMPNHIHAIVIINGDNGDDGCNGYDGCGRDAINRVSTTATILRQYPFQPLRHLHPLLLYLLQTPFPFLCQHEIHLAFVVFSQLAGEQVFGFYRADGFRGVRGGHAGAGGDVAGRDGVVAHAAKDHRFVQGDAVGGDELGFEVGESLHQVSHPTDTLNFLHLYQIVSFGRPTGLVAALYVLIPPLKLRTSLNPLSLSMLLAR